MVKQFSCFIINMNKMKRNIKKKDLFFIYDDINVSKEWTFYYEGYKMKCSTIFFLLLLTIIVKIS